MIESLNHNGVLFQEPFESKGFNEIDGVKISLLAEEMLWKFAPYMNNKKYNENEVFLNNVWIDLKPQLPLELQERKFPNDFMTTICKMTITSIALKSKKSEYNKSHKKEIDDKKSEIKEKYGYCYKNGLKTEISNPYVESSRWFISRGELCGRWVSRVMPEDIEINASENVPCIGNHHWKKIELRQTDYIATYKINIGFGKVFIDKFVWLSANSIDKQNDNEHKYEKARKLSLKINDIEKKVLGDVISENRFKRDNALITYLVLTFGIRIGNDLGENNFRDKNVRGASTLCKENIILEKGNKLHLKFIGKDSVPYSETMKIDSRVYDILNKLIENKKSTDKVFEYANSQSVNTYLKSIYKGEITVKNFRTAKAGLTLSNEIQKRNWKNLTDKEFKNNLMECCLQTSLLLNHHKTVSDEQKEKISMSSDKRLDNARNTMNKTIENVNKKLNQLKSDKEDFELYLVGHLLESKLEEIKEKENELNEKIKSAKKKYDDVEKEIIFKKNSIDVNLNTAISNYSTPKLSISLCKYADKKPSLIYSKSQLKKFEWAMDVKDDYWKKYPDTEK